MKKYQLDHVLRAAGRSRVRSRVVAEERTDSELDRLERFGTYDLVTFGGHDIDEPFVAPAHDG